MPENAKTPAPIIAVADVKGRMGRLLADSLAHVQENDKKATVYQQRVKEGCLVIVAELQERLPDYPWKEKRIHFDSKTGVLSEVGDVEQKPALEAVPDEGGDSV